jgi:hypothetical protein
MPKTKKEQPPKKEQPAQFEAKEYDVSPSILCVLMLCPLTCAAMPYSITLNLGPDEG